MADKLSSYRSRRHFQRTPEPSDLAPASTDGHEQRFVVHKHAATRLHYDLRLEMGGVLASWAIPKGPSDDRSERRLAVQTEDHPLAYADFEGRIEGEYGAGDSLLWDRGTFETVPPGQALQMREKGHLVLELHGAKLRGRWHLLRTRTGGRAPQWLFFKARDEFADNRRDMVRSRPESAVSTRRVARGPVRLKDRQARHPSPVQLLLRVWPPMLAATAPSRRLEAGAFVFEVKYDGFRACAALSGGRVALQSRNGIDLSGRFPSVVEAVARIDLPELVLDGEVVALDTRGVGRFAELQQSGTRLRYCVFDLLWLDGEDLRPRPLEDRRELLESMLATASAPIEIAERLGSTVDESLAEASRRGLEGIIAKRLGSSYVGTRSTAWLKLKLLRSQELAIVGYTPISSGASAVGALLLAVADGHGGYAFAGKVGTGFDDEMRAQLLRILDRERIEEPPVERPVPRVKDARWVMPRQVAQIVFSEWTRDGRLRHPVFKGLRDDKKPEECTREGPLADGW